MLSAFFAPYGSNHEAGDPDLFAGPDSTRPIQGVGRKGLLGLAIERLRLAFLCVAREWSFGYLLNKELLRPMKTLGWKAQNKATAGG